MSGRDDKRLTVPKFTSFKPKTATPDQATGSSGTPEDEARESHRGSKRRRHRPHRSHGEDEKVSRGDKRSRSRSRSRSPRAGKRRVRGDEDPRAAREREDGDQQPPATSLTSLPLFVIDKKGDPLIRKFGIDKYKVPHFRRQGRENVLGTDGYLYIHRDAADEEFSIRRWGQFYGPSLRGKNPFGSKIRQTQARPLRAGRDVGSHASDTGDFISLSSRRRGGLRDEVLSDDGGQPDYRSIEKARSRGAPDDDIDTDSAESSEDDGPAESDPLKLKSIELARRVKEYPNDITAWLELIDHQDVLMKAGADVNEDLQVDEVKSFAEIKLSMYEKALGHAESPGDRERLLVGQMREGEKVWDQAAMATRWSKLAKEIDGSFLLWRANLDFEMSNITTFNFDSVKKILCRRLALLNARALQQQPASPLELAPLYAEMIYVFLRLTRFLHDCGYRELSVAAWQAILELNFSGGDGFAAPQPDVPESFAQFWESEVLRIGEEGAMGWDHFVKTGGPDPPDPVVTGQHVPLESRDVYKAWAAEELRRARQARRPARTLDEGNEDDPFRVVMYSDLEGFLFGIPRDVLKVVRAELWDAFLAFCQLPELSRTRSWQTDPFIAPRDASFERVVADPFSHSIDPDEDSTRPPPEFVTGCVTPATAPAFVCSLLHWGRHAKAEEMPVDSEWVSLALKTLVKMGYVELAGYCLTLEWVVNGKGIRKAARELIRMYPDNIGLYHLYGLFEWANGNVEMSKTVLSSATQLGREPEASATLPLWLTWAWLELANEAPVSRVLARLCFQTDGEGVGEGPSPTMVLRHKQELTSRSAHLLLQGDLDGFSNNARLLALFEYLSSTTGSEPRSERQGSISSAMEVVWRYSKALVARGQGDSTQHEELLGFAAMLLYLHTTLGPYRKVFFSAQLRACVLLFPANTNFLSLFDWAATNLRINDEFRNLVADHVLTRDRDTAGLRACVVQREIRRGSVYTAAAAFERAMDGEAGRNPWFWGCYVRFCRARDDREARIGGGRRKRKGGEGGAVASAGGVMGRKAYYRSVARCPWAKGLAMEGFTTLVSGMDKAELKGVYGSMEEKGLRVHVDMAEFAERRRRKR